MSRTDEGYAHWKEIPSAVKSAREIATMGIAIIKLKAALLAPLEPIVEWLNNRLIGGAK